MEQELYQQPWKDGNDHDTRAISWQFHIQAGHTDNGSEEEVQAWKQQDHDEVFQAKDVEIGVHYWAKRDTKALGWLLPVVWRGRASRDLCKQLDIVFYQPKGSQKDKLQNQTVPLSDSVPRAIEIDSWVIQNHPKFGRFWYFQPFPQLRVDPQSQPRRNPEL